MRHIYLISGPCGCGKTSLAKAFAEHLVNEGGRRQVYLVHGDSFHAGFIEAPQNGGCTSEGLEWPDILRFNWDCMLTVVRNALTRGLDVVMDYVVEDELPRVCSLAAELNACLHYTVLTASPDAIRQRLRARGNAELIDRALFLKEKLDGLRENQGHLLENTALSVPETVALLNDPRFIMN